MLAACEERIECRPPGARHRSRLVPAGLLLRRRRSRRPSPGPSRAGEGGQHVDGRRLAGAVRAEEPIDLPGHDPQVDPRDRLDVLERAPEPYRPRFLSRRSRLTSTEPTCGTPAMPGTVNEPRFRRQTSSTTRRRRQSPPTAHSRPGSRFSVRTRRSARLPRSPARARPDAERLRVAAPSRTPTRPDARRVDLAAGCC